MHRRIRVSPADSLTVVLVFLLGGIGAADGEPPKPKSQGQSDWQPLFDGKTLKGWKISPFGGEGDVYVENEQLFFDFGSSLTGISYAGKPPKSNYEIQLEAKRLGGSDFFCGLTFPVKTSYCSLIVGGWGGSLVGLSSIDGEDAAENDTQLTMAFARDRWYRIKLRVDDEQITVWIDGKQVIRQKTKSHQITIRPEVELSRPLGICTWETRRRRA